MSKYIKEINIDNNLNQRFKHKNERKNFTDEEDKKLQSLVSILGTNCWPLIAKAMEGRTTRQCRERYKTYLSPQVKNGPWSYEEDIYLIRLYSENGPKWAEISKYFQGRSDNNVKNRWYTHLKSKYIPNLSPIQNYDLNSLIMKDLSENDHSCLDNSLLDGSWCIF